MDNKEKYFVVAYYYYTKIQDAMQFAEHHLKYCKSLKLRGRIYVAEEGINGTFSGLAENCEAYMQDLKNNPMFSGVSFKVDEATEHAFNRMHCRYKNEIVNSGLKELDDIDPNEITGKHLRGNEFLELKDDEDVVILDVRSNYETRIGKFKNAITLDIETFREFPSKLPELEKYKDKKIITYCTGGVKCEKASGFLMKNGFKDVYQLHDGIIGYSKDTGGKDFEGVLYVYDGRVTVPVNQVNPATIGHCKVCFEGTNRSLNCANVDCNEQFNMCEKCANELEGACSEICKTAPGKRTYNGTGYYTRPVVE